MTPELANALLIKIYKELQKPIQNGAALRTQMFDEIKKGKKPTGYRYEFEQDLANHIFELLKDAKIQFQMSFPTDELSNNDFRDILEFVRKKIK